jgi:SAM-dependent methyltransferase
MAPADPPPRPMRRPGALMSGAAASGPPPPAPPSPGMTWRMDAGAYARLWAGLAAPARAAVADALGLAPGVALLDIGCGPGDFCALAIERGAKSSGLDLDPAMIALARTRTPSADLRVGSMDTLPWPDAAFDAVTASNVLQFADTPARPLSEARRVLRPGGRLAICSWSPPRRNQVDLVESAVHAAIHGRRPTRAPQPLNQPGVLDDLLRPAGFRPLSTARIAVPFVAADQDTLEAAFLADSDPPPARREQARRAIIDAAAPFRRGDGSYRLENEFRVIVATTVAPSPEPPPT